MKAFLQEMFRKACDPLAQGAALTGFLFAAGLVFLLSYALSETQDEKDEAAALVQWAIKVAESPKEQQIVQAMAQAIDASSGGASAEVHLAYLLKKLPSRKANVMLADGREVVYDESDPFFVMGNVVGKIRRSKLK